MLRTAITAVCLLVLSAASFSAPQQDLAASSEPATRSEEIMVMGVSHLNRETLGELKLGTLDQVNQALIDWASGAVIVEWLPPDWPVGEGRDYRRIDDLTTLSSLWGLEVEGNQARLDEQLAKPLADRDLILTGKYFYLDGDQLNAACYWWMAEEAGADSADLSGITRGNLRYHEQGAHGFKVAASLGHERVYGFDYQGDDSGWLLGAAMHEAESEGTAEDLAQIKEIDHQTDEISRLLSDVDTKDLIAFYSVLNGEKWMELQHWAHHEIFPQIRFRAYGMRLTANLELRNARMFESGAQRALILVGAGHKYFIDKRFKWYGYRWVDPLDHLPEN